MPWATSGSRRAATLLAGDQRRLAVRRLHHQKIANIGRTDLATQLLVQRFLRGGQRAHAFQFVVPVRAVVKHQRQIRGDQRRPSTTKRSVAPARISASTGTAKIIELVVDETARQQHRQHPARHRQRDNQADDGEQTELGEAGETRQQHGAEAADRGQHAQAQRWPDARQGRGRCGARRGLREQVDRVVDGLADQRHAEAQRDAVHEAERQADRGDAGDDPAQHRQQAQAPACAPSDRRTAGWPATNTVAISEKRVTSAFMRARVRTANTGGPVSISLALAGGRSTGGGTRCRAAAKAASIRCSACSCASMSNPAATVCTISSARRWCRRKPRRHRALPDAPGAPNAPISRSISPVGSAGMLRLAKHAHVGAEQLDIRLQRRVQGRRREMPGHDGGTQQIAVAPQQIAVARERRLVAVADDAECRIRPQRRRPCALLSAASVSGGAPSIASRIRRETTPSRS